MLAVIQIVQQTQVSITNPIPNAPPSAQLKLYSMPKPPQTLSNNYVSDLSIRLIAKQKVKTFIFI
jgi:hypothetical protein